MSSPPGNPAQRAIIEQEWTHWLTMFGADRPPKKRSIWVSVRCAQIGPHISSQEIGKYYANRAKKEAGVPRASKKTPEQIAILKDTFSEDPFPCTGVKILIIDDTGLTKSQIDAWFVNQRKMAEQRGEWLEVPPANPDASKNAAKMWRAHKADPEGYAALIRSGRIHIETGEEIVPGQSVTPAQYEDEDEDKAEMAAITPNPGYRKQIIRDVEEAHRHAPASSTDPEVSHEQVTSEPPLTERRRRAITQFGPHVGQKRRRIEDMRSTRVHVPSPRP